MTLVYLQNGRAVYGPNSMPFETGGCLLPAQEEALQVQIGLNARVRFRDAKKNQGQRQLTVAGPKGKEFEECAEEANSSSPTKDGAAKGRSFEPTSSLRS